LLLNISLGYLIGMPSSVLPLRKGESSTKNRILVVSSFCKEEAILDPAVPAP
jgi:hypothetical protein